MLKIVVDTNIFIAALLGKESGYSRKIIEKVLNGTMTPLMGDALFNEYIEVMTRNTILDKCLLNEQERFVFLTAFMNCCQWSKIYFRWRPNLKDEGDNHLIELAIAGGAKYIVTHNIKDLKSGELFFKGLEIVTPEYFIKEVVWE